MTTDLELWHGHLKRPVTHLPRGLDDLQQQRHVRGVERAAGVRAHRHAELPLHVHQLGGQTKSHQPRVEARFVYIDKQTYIHDRSKVLEHLNFLKERPTWSVRLPLLIPFLSLL